MDGTKATQNGLERFRVLIQDQEEVVRKLQAEPKAHAAFDKFVQKVRAAEEDLRLECFREAWQAVTGESREA